MRLFDCPIEITQVAFDYGVTLVTEVGALRIENEGVARSPLNRRKFLVEFGQQVTTADLDEATRELTLSFSDGWSVIVPSDPHYEAWTYNTADGGLVVMGPEGRLTTWDGN